MFRCFNRKGVFLLHFNFQQFLQSPEGRDLLLFSQTQTRFTAFYLYLALLEKANYRGGMVPFSINNLGNGYYLTRYETVKHAFQLLEKVGLVTVQGDRLAVKYWQKLTTDHKTIGQPQLPIKPPFYTKTTYPAPTVPDSPELHQIAKKIVTKLAQLTQQTFTNTTRDVDYICFWLRQGYTEAQFDAVILVKHHTWAHDATMQHYLRPRTLFGQHFDQYVRQAPAVETVTELKSICQATYPDTEAALQYALDAGYNVDLDQLQAICQLYGAASTF
jgi:uncharacterized phage protein (TIGR02220 family)